MTTGARHGKLSRMVLKAMGIFGGVQMLTILCGIVRTKLIAVWIGAAGVGLFSIYNGAIELIGSLTQFGLRNSSVRDISANRDSSRLGVIVKAVRRLGWVFGLLGAVVMLGAAPFLSRETFGDDGHTWYFAVLAVSVFLASLTAGEMAVMQGLERLKALAKASLWGVVAGFVVSVPMIYVWRLDSVVPAVVAYSVVTTVAAYIYRVRGVESRQPMTARETWNIGRGFIILGAFMVASDFITQLVSYIFTAWLNINAGDTEVGYYRSGFTVVNRYVGMVFAAISMEYYPRLASVVTSRQRLSLFVGHEMTLVLWILLPLVSVFIACAPLIVTILYTPDFVVTVPFMILAMVGTVWRGISWCMAFVILAKGDGRTFIVTESVSCAFSLVLNIAGYKLWGLGGLGAAYMFWYLIYTAIVGIVYRRYRLWLPRRVIILAAVVTVWSAIIAAAALVLPWWVLAIGAVISTVAAGVWLKRNF